MAGQANSGTESAAGKGRDRVKWKDREARKKGRGKLSSHTDKERKSKFGSRSTAGSRGLGRERKGKVRYVS